MTELHVARGGREQLHHDRELLLDTYRDVYADKLDDPFFSPDRFWQRLEAYGSRDGFTVVTGRIKGQMIGYALGFTLVAGSRWWAGLVDPAPAEFTIENGHRTFAVNEIMVRQQWRRKGHARTLHNSLLQERPEERATLLVDPGNTPAVAAYKAWGWQVVGPLRPFPDSPTFDAMLLSLPDQCIGLR